MKFHSDLHLRYIWGEKVTLSNYCTFYGMEQKKINLYCFQKRPSTFGERCNRNKDYN